MKHYPDTIRAAAATPVQQLTSQELVTDEILRVLAKGDPDWQRGEISEQDQALLVMILPDLCGELLAWRAAARLEPSVTRPRLTRVIPGFSPRHPATTIGE